MAIPDSLRGHTSFFRSRLRYFKQAVTEEQAEQCLMKRQPVLADTGHGVERLDTVMDLATLGALESPQAAGSPQLLAARTLATGQLDADGVYDGEQKLSAYQTVKHLSQPYPHRRLTVRCAAGSSDSAGSLAELTQLYEHTLQQTSVPIARFHAGGPVKFQAVGGEQMDTLFALHQMAFFDHPWKPEWFAPYVHNPNSERILAMGEDGALGFYILGHQRIAPDGADVDFVAVSPQAQGKKVGDQLMLRILQRARERGDNRLYLEVDTHKKGAQSLYQKCGFEIIGTRPNFYGTGHDAFIMRADDVCGAAGSAAIERLQKNFRTA